MDRYIYFLIAAVLGLAIGFLLKVIFNILPEKWLQDYDYDPNAEGFRKARRMSFIPHGLVAGLFCALFYVLTIALDPTLINGVKVMHLAAVFLSVPVLFLVLISDKLNRIIPDQFWIFLLLCGFLLLASDYVEGSPWYSAEAKWYIPLANRLGAAVLGFGVLFLIGIISEFFTHRTAMGQGDMKLLVGCGMLTGLYGIVVLIYAAVILAVFFAIPLFIKKQKRLKEERLYVALAENKVLAQLELKKKRNEMHYADDPDYLAFGPFIAIGCAIFISMEPFFFEKMIDTLNLLGLYF